MTQNIFEAYLKPYDKVTGKQAVTTKSEGSFYSTNNSEEEADGETEAVDSGMPYELEKQLEEAKRTEYIKTVGPDFLRDQASLLGEMIDTEFDSKKPSKQGGFYQ